QRTGGKEIIGGFVLLWFWPVEKNSLLIPCSLEQLLATASKLLANQRLKPKIRNSLLIPCYQSAFGDFGQNSVTQQLLGKNSLHFSLFFCRNASEVNEN